MSYLRIRNLFTIFILLLPQGVLAQGAPPGAGPPGGAPGLPVPATATVSVDCTAGDSINDALATPAVTLTIEISGICAEDVVVERNRVNLVGGNPLTDGIQPGPGDVLNQALNLFNVHEVTVRNLSFSAAVVGFAINNSTFVFIDNVRIHNNYSVGFISGGSGVINLSNSFISDSLTGAIVSNGASLACTACEFSYVGIGVNVRLGSELTISNSTIQASHRAITMRGGARIWSFGGNTFEGGTLAMRIFGNNSVELRNDDLIGSIDIRQKSVVDLFNVDHDVPAGVNYIWSDSSVITRGNTSVEGDFYIFGFSRLTLPAGTSSAGSLICKTGGDAFCDADPFGGGGGSSTCGLCPFP
jgi:hypothetical protein